MRVLTFLFGLLLPSVAIAQPSSVNPVVGSVWTYLGPTYGAAWVPTPYGSGPVPPGDNDWLAKWTSGGMLTTAYSAASGGNLIGTFIDSTPPGAWGPVKLHVGSPGNVNNAVFASDNNLPPATLALPVAIGAYGKISPGSTGNHVFAMYGLAELYGTSGTAIAAEFTARNNTSPSNTDRSLPPNTGIGTTTGVTKGMNVTCGFNTTDCSIGIHIGNEVNDPTKSVFNTGHYIQLYRQFGLVVEAMPTGSQYSVLSKNNGEGVNLQLQTTGPLVGDNTVMNVVDSDPTVTRFSVRQSGDIHTMGHLVFAQPPYPRPALSACGTSPDIRVSTDSAGTVLVGTGTVTSCTITFGRAFGNNPSCVLGFSSGMPALFLSDRSVSLITVSSAGAANMAGFLFDYHCLDTR